MRMVSQSTGTSHVRVSVKLVWIPAQPNNFVDIGHEIISVIILILQLLTVTFPSSLWANSADNRLVILVFFLFFFFQKTGFSIKSFFWEKWDIYFKMLSAEKSITHWNSSIKHHSRSSQRDSVTWIRKNTPSLDILVISCCKLHGFGIVYVAPWHLVLKFQRCTCICLNQRIYRRKKYC